VKRKHAAVAAVLFAITSATHAQGAAPVVQQQQISLTDAGAILI